jgi:hypothetical protein
VTTSESGAWPGQQDSVGCLLVVAGYDDISSALRSVTEEAVSRINVSPDLADFFEVRFVGLGSRPTRDGDRSAAVSRLAAALTQPTGPAARHYFALLAADRSAAVVAQLLRECGTHHVVGRLPIRCRGLASVEDRLPEPEKPDQPDDAQESRPANILVAATGSWRRAGLVHEAQRFASELLPDFTSGTEAGLTVTQLGQLRQPDAGDDPGELPWPCDELTPVPDRPGRHHLPALPPAARAPGSDDAAPPHAELALRPAPPLPASSPQRFPAWWQRALWRRQAGGVRERRQPVRLSARGATRPTDERERPAPPSMLVFLALVGDEGMGDWATWRRGQSVLIEIDAKLARRAAYRVRALRGAGDAGMTEPREAGHLARRDMGRPARILDFPRVLNIVRTAVKREVTFAAARGMPPLRPTVVFFAADAPFADAVTIGIYGELTREAEVTWIVPEQLGPLWSTRYKEGGARKLDDHPAVADELVRQLPNGETRDQDE